MPIITAAIDPVTRIEGHLKVEVKVDTVNGVQQVVDAFSVGTLYRGFEKLLEGRDPRDATIITSRICGVCPTSHAHAASLALDGAFGVAGDTEARTASRLLRNLVHGACYLESAILHFYLLSLPDFIPALPMAPWLPGWEMGHRFDKDILNRFTRHFTEAVAQRRNCHEMGAIYGGKLPHTPAFIMGGFTAVSSADDKAFFSQYLESIITWVQNAYVPDAELLASIWSEYQQLGRGYGHLLAFGVFEQDNTSDPALLFQRGRMMHGSPLLLPVDTSHILEQVKYSWYEDAGGHQPIFQADTHAQYPKPPAYSWLKAPRYDGIPYEVGALARLTISGKYSNGVSVMDRHMARAHEALKIALAMRQWLSELPVYQGAYTHRVAPTDSMSEGLTEAPRGALGHWLQVTEGKIGKYQIVTPTCWNLSPRDEAGQRGPLEQALIGVPVANIDKPIEVLRVVHSFDPCLDCATHVMRAESGTKMVAVGSIADSRNGVGAIASSSVTPWIIGVGNLLMADDGVGVHALAELRKAPISGVRMIEMGTAILHGVNLVEPGARVLLIDAVQGGQAPGTIYYFKAGQAAAPSATASLHSLGLRDAMQVLALGTPPKVTVIGVEPLTLGYGTELSTTVRAVLPRVVALARTIVLKWIGADQPARPKNASDGFTSSAS